MASHIGRWKRARTPRLSVRWGCCVATPCRCRISALRCCLRIAARVIVTEAGRAVLDYARAVLGLSQLCAIVSPDNANSIRALEKLGLQQHGLRELSPETAAVLYYEIDLGPARSAS